jgi:hypothetical protein
MANFIVTFRIASDSGYQERYDSFVDAVHVLAQGGVGSTWEETTSFLVFRAQGTADSVCQHLYLKSSFDGSKDIMVVIDIGARQKATKGPIKYLSTLTGLLGF